MKTQLLLACSLVGLGLAQEPTPSTPADAPETTDNPIGVVYKGALLDKDSTDVRGTISATAADDQRGVVFSIMMHGFPEGKGPFAYHIHDKPVPEDGNCTLTAAHLDPYGRGQTPPCNAGAPETCEVGDLSGKHGKIEVSGDEHFTAHYTDLYASTKEGAIAFFGNRSFVVHDAAGARVNCGNFKLIEENDDDDDGEGGDGDDGEGGDGDDGEGGDGDDGEDGEGGDGDDGEGGDGDDDYPAVTVTTSDCDSKPTGETSYPPHSSGTAEPIESETGYPTGVPTGVPTEQPPYPTGEPTHHYPTGTGSPSGSATYSPVPTDQPPIGGAGRLAISLGGVMAALAALAF
ncbi:hypothetical protein FQN57_006886 [Myotisia sp. PD_48]|nr:hypothetical protein FQN57_006886 [Myotisia sp. PD_48]